MTLDEAISLARRAHEGATDKAGRPYIEHPLRVMERLRSDSPVEESVLMAAILHDVIEDTDVSAEALLAAGCPLEAVEAVVALTKRPEESYHDFLRRLSPNPIARRIKLADIEDNADEARLTLLPQARAAELRAKYHRARLLLDELPATTPSTVDAARAAGNS
ncbi:MAG: HD domain-containing protein [Actinomycetota bacterium]|nr:HD domain-containing protein [Actinomycetota bacterium]